MYVLISVEFRIIDPLVLIQLRLDKIVVSVIVENKFHLGEVSLAVPEQLGQVNAVGEDVRVIYERIVVVLGTALPGQHHIIGVARVAVRNRSPVTES